MTTHGTVNHTIWRPVTNQEAEFRHAFNDEFVATYRFLNSSLGTSLGIVRRACNFNNQASDCDFKYRKLAPPPGNNAWALFEFTSASPKFWLLIQESDAGNNASFGIGAGEPAYNDYSGKISGFCFAVAVREDGGNPWGGTTVNNGTDTKSSPVWTPGPSRLSMFPLSNQARGQWRIDRSGMHPISLWIDNNNDRTRCTLYHFLATEDSVTFLVGHDAGCNYDVSYFGKYNAVDPTGANYAFFANLANALEPFNTDYQDSVFPWSGGGSIRGRRHWGSNSAGFTYQGTNSIAGNTFSWSGGIIDKPTFQTVPIGLSFPLGMDYNEEFNRRIVASPVTGKIEVFNWPVYVDGLGRGYVGELSNLKYCHTLPNHATIHGRKFAVFGRTQNSGKLMTQWLPNAVCGKLATVFGEQF